MELITKLAGEVPNLAAMIVMLLVLLRYVSKRDSLMREETAIRDKMLSEMFKENMEARNHSRTVIEDCTKVMGEMTKVVERCGIVGRK